jgi:hypothetical protein
MAKVDLQDLARRGALARLAELRDEERQLLEQFPELVKHGMLSPAMRPVAAPTDGKPPRKYSMSPAMRKSVSERMKTYWASQRRKKEGKKR